MKSIFVALLVFMVCIGCSKSNTQIAEDLGFSSPSIVGEWHKTDKGRSIVFTILSDGTGDVMQNYGTQGEKTQEIKWRMVKDKFEIAVGNGPTWEVTLRENNTLALKLPEDLDSGILILRKKTDDR